MNLQSFLNEFLKKENSAFSTKSKIRNFLLEGEEEQFNKNLEKYPFLLDYYKNNPITYKLNNLGFRADYDFIPNKNIEVDIYLGCSHTFGHFLHSEHVWPSIVSKRLERKAMNLAVPGGSIESSFFLLSKFIDYFKVNNVFHFQPIYPRYSFVSKHPKTGEYSDFTWNLVNDPKEYKFFPWSKEYLLDVMTTNEYIAYEYYKHINAISGLCRSKGINYFYFDKIYIPLAPGSILLYKQDSRDGLNPYWDDQIEDKSRIPAQDLKHYSVAHQKGIAKMFLKYIKAHPDGYIPQYSAIGLPLLSTDKHVLADKLILRPNKPI